MNDLLVDQTPDSRFSHTILFLAAGKGDPGVYLIFISPERTD